MDSWIRQHLNKEFDNDGQWAVSGKVSHALLHELLDETYFDLPSPKSTGRELFNTFWLESKLSRIQTELAKEDVQATLLEFSVETIKREIFKLRDAGEIIICGGGVHNAALLSRLKERLEKFKITTSDENGINPDCVESVAFAWFASKTMMKKAIDFTPFTGARHPVIAGGVYYAE